MVERVNFSPQPLQFSARTMPPRSATARNTEKPHSAAMSVTSAISMPKRRSGLSQP